MDYKHVSWEVLPGIFLPMMENSEGDLFCTNKAICEGLGITESAIRDIYRRNMGEFDAVSVAKCDAKNFLLNNKKPFGIKRVRGDMRIWGEDDMITFAFFSKSEKSRDFRSQLRRFIKENAKIHYGTKSQYEELHKEVKSLRSALSYLSEEMAKNKVAAEYDASLAGKLLSNQRKTKSMRSLSH